jgi:hypothetical protein
LSFHFYLKNIAFDCEKTSGEFRMNSSVSFIVIAVLAMTITVVSGNVPEWLRAPQSRNNPLQQRVSNVAQPPTAPMNQ